MRAATADRPGDGRVHGCSKTNATVVAIIAAEITCPVAADSGATSPATTLRPKTLAPADDIAATRTATGAIARSVFMTLPGPMIRITPTNAVMVPSAPKGVSRSPGEKTLAKMAPKIGDVNARIAATPPARSRCATAMRMIGMKLLNSLSKATCRSVGSGNGERPNIFTGDLGEEEGASKHEGEHDDGESVTSMHCSINLSGLHHRNTPPEE